LPCGHSVANHLMALRRRFCALPFRAAHARSHPCRTSPFPRQARRTHPAESRSSSYGLVHHLRLLPTPPRGGAVIVSFRPESVCLERTCTSLDVCAWRRTGSARAAGRPGAAGSDRKHERFEPGWRSCFRSGSARRFATPVEPLSVFSVSSCLRGWPLPPYAPLPHPRVRRISDTPFSGARQGIQRPPPDDQIVRKTMPFDLKIWTAFTLS